MPIAQAANGKEPKLVDQSAATRGLIRWVALHPTNIDQRVGIVVEHFREHFARLLDGQAKAMVVCDSTQGRRLLQARHRQLHRRPWLRHRNRRRILWHLVDPESPPGEFSEASMNPRATGRDLAAAFATPEFRIMLVVN